MDDPEAYICAYEKNQTMSKMSLILAGEVAQVEVARIALAHPLGLQDKPLALRVHDIQRSLFVVKAVGEGLVDGPMRRIRPCQRCR